MKAEDKEFQKNYNFIKTFGLNSMLGKRNNELIESGNEALNQILYSCNGYLITKVNYKNLYKQKKLLVTGLSKLTFTNS